MEDAPFEDFENCTRENDINKFIKSMHYIIQPIIRNFSDLKEKQYNLNSNNLLKLPTTNAYQHVTQATYFKGSIL